MMHNIRTFGMITLALTCMVLAGCDTESPLALTKAEPVIDTAPPTAPTGLYAHGDEYNVTVAWDANVMDEDFFGFMVYRVVWGIQYPMLDLPQKENSWIDDHTVNVACTYLVTALDIAGNESAWAAVNFLGEPSEVIKEIREQS